MAKKPVKPKKAATDPNKKARVHKELEGFEIGVNPLGEITSNYSIEQINQFLGRHVRDKKLVDRAGQFGESPRPAKPRTKPFLSKTATRKPSRKNRTKTSSSVPAVRPSAKKPWTTPKRKLPTPVVSCRWTSSPWRLQRVGSTGAQSFLKRFHLDELPLGVALDAGAPLLFKGFDLC